MFWLSDRLCCKFLLYFITSTFCFEFEFDPAVNLCSILGFDHLDFMFWLCVQLCCKFVFNFRFRLTPFFVLTVLGLCFDCARPMFWLSVRLCCEIMFILCFDHLDFMFWFWIRLGSLFVFDSGFRPTRLFVSTGLALCFDSAWPII